MWGGLFRPAEGRCWWNQTVEGALVNDDGDEALAALPTILRHRANQVQFTPKTRGETAASTKTLAPRAAAM